MPGKTGQQGLPMLRPDLSHSDTAIATAKPIRGDGRPVALVFTGALLPQSETFIADHVLSLRRHRACLVGLSRVPHGPLPEGIEMRVLGRDRTRRLDRLALAFSPIRGPLDRVAADVQPELIHAHFLNNALLLLPFLRRSGLPLVVTAHGRDVAARPAAMAPIDRLLHATRLKAVGMRADVILCVSDAVRTLAVERGLPESKCRTMPLGIPLAPFAAMRPRQVAGRLLFVGRLVEKKGLAFLLPAVARARAAGLAVDLHIIGDGSQRRALEALNRRLDTAARFMGAQPRARVLEALAEASALILPSHRAADGDSEGLPIALLEAQAAGVPVIAFDNGPAREAVVAGRTGLLVPERDVDALAAAIRVLLTDAALRARLSAAAIRHVAERFDIKDRTAALERVYDEVTERRCRYGVCCPGLVPTKEARA